MKTLAVYPRHESTMRQRLECALGNMKSVDEWLTMAFEKSSPVENIVMSSLMVTFRDAYRQCDNLVKALKEEV